MVDNTRSQSLSRLEEAITILTQSKHIDLDPELPPLQNRRGYLSLQLSRE